MKVDDAVEFNDARIMDEIDAAILAADEADTEARYDTTADEVIEQLVTDWKPADKHRFMTALRVHNKQHIACVLMMLQDSFETVVKVKKEGILRKGMV